MKSSGYWEAPSKMDYPVMAKNLDFMGFADKSQGQLSHVEVLKKQLVETKSEVLICIGKETSWIATTIAVHNPFEFQKRDIYKPRQRKKKKKKKSSECHHV
ncbi:MAG: hypothetical protein MZU95_12670 [Desulfomicrobium escambiense]|nr:hypothetical protein [Desulfomicrobium escambiense]